MTEDELAEQISRFHKESFGWALSLCEWDEAAAEDILQTAYARTFSGKASFGGRSSFRTWLFGVIRRVSQEEGRRRFRDRSRLTDLGLVGNYVSEERESPVGQLIRSEESAALLAALAQLPPRQREVLHLVFYEDMSVSDASEVMAISVGSARTHYDRGKKKMRSILGVGHA